MNKYLEKVAAVYGDLYKGYNTILRRSSNKSTFQGAGIGATLGSGLGYAGTNKVEDYDKRGNLFRRNATTSEKVIGAIGGGLSGAALGASLGNASKVKSINDKLYGKGKNAFGKEQTKHGKKFEDIFTKARQKSQSKQEYRNNSFRYSSRGVQDILNDLGAPPGGFKTKAEAKSHFRRAAMRHHPDRGGNSEVMAKINKAFEEFQKHPDGFEKLAGYNYLIKLVGN